MTPEELHYAAAHWNWDDGPETLTKIVRRKDCALATATMVFWMSEPQEVMGAYRTAAAAKKDDYDGFYPLLVLIRDRIAAGAFERHDIGYDPRHDTSANPQGVDWTEDWDPIAKTHALPKSMLRAVEGRMLDPNYLF